MSVVKSLFLTKDKSLQELWDDPQLREKLLKEAARELPDCPEFIWHHPKEQLLALAMQQDFSDFEESLYIAGIINKYMGESEDIFPQVSKHRGLELAERSLVSLSFFYDNMAKRTNRYGAPSPEFYGQQGIMQFEHNHKYKVAKHFNSWTEFWNEPFKISNLRIE